MAELAILAATAAGASAGTAATIGTITSIGLTAASAFSAISAGQAESADLKIQARQATLSSKQETLRGKQTALAIQDRLTQDLASQNALFGARGMIASEGSAEAAREVSKINAGRDIDLARFDADIAAGNFDQQSANLKAQASNAKTQGFVNAFDTLSGLQLYGVGTDADGKSIPIPKRKPTTLLTGI